MSVDSFSFCAAVYDRLWAPVSDKKTNKPPPSNTSFTAGCRSRGEAKETGMGPDIAFILVIT